MAKPSEGLSLLLSPKCCTKSLLHLPSSCTFSFKLSKDPFLKHSSSSSYVSNYICQATRKKNSQLQPILKSTNTVNEEEGASSHNDFEEDDDDDFLDDEEEEEELFVGDGAGGGGISLAGTEWDKEALALAEETMLAFDKELKIYAFKTLKNSMIRVRIEKLSNRSGSPNMEDIQDFCSAYRAKLDEAELAGSIPQNIYLEVSSPGVERIVQIPEDLDRFKDRPMYVKYIAEADETGSSSESEGIFKLVSFDLESCCCTWGIADVRVNREKAGKGRPLNKKQREWRLNTPFQSLILVRVHSDI